MVYFTVSITTAYHHEGHSRYIFFQIESRRNTNNFVVTLKTSDIQQDLYLQYFVTNHDVFLVYFLFV